MGIAKRTTLQLILNMHQILPALMRIRSSTVRMIPGLPFFIPSLFFPARGEDSLAKFSNFTIRFSFLVVTTSSLLLHFLSLLGPLVGRRRKMLVYTLFCFSLGSLR